MKSDKGAKFKGAPMDISRLQAVNALKRAAATAHGEVRSQEVRAKVLAAMSIIDSELSANNDVYPNNEGHLTLTEVCCRAGISCVTTIYGKKHLELKGRVDLWLGEINERALKAKNKGCATQSAEPLPRGWKELYEDMANAYTIDALRWREDRALHELSQARVLELERVATDLNSVIDQLRDQLNAFSDHHFISMGLKKLDS